MVEKWRKTPIHLTSPQFTHSFQTYCMFVIQNLQRHFSAWYNLVLERRLQMGKALAMRDWKLMLRAWNAWKAFVRERRMDIENKRHKMEVISTQR